MGRKNCVVISSLYTKQSLTILGHKQKHILSVIHRVASFIFTKVSDLLTVREHIANLQLLNLFLKRITRKIFAISQQMYAHNMHIQGKYIIKERPKREKKWSMMGKVLRGNTHRDRRLSNCWKVSTLISQISLCRRSLK